MKNSRTRRSTHKDALLGNSSGKTQENVETHRDLNLSLLSLPGKESILPFRLDDPLQEFEGSLVMQQQCRDIGQERGNSAFALSKVPRSGHCNIFSLFFFIGAVVTCPRVPHDSLNHKETSFTGSCLQVDEKNSSQCFSSRLCPRSICVSPATSSDICMRKKLSVWFSF